MKNSVEEFESMAWGRAIWFCLKLGLCLGLAYVLAMVVLMAVMFGFGFALGMTGFAAA